MGNCLVTKFQSVFDSSDTPYLGEIEFFTKEGGNAGTRFVRVDLTTGSTAHVHSNITLYSDDQMTHSLGKDFEITASINMLYPEDAAGLIRVSNRYGIKTFALNTRSGVVIDNLNYMSTLTEVRCYRLNLRGNAANLIEEVPVTPLQGTVIVNFSEVYGATDNLNHLKLNANSNNGFQLNFRGSDLVGDSSFLKNMPIKTTVKHIDTDRTNIGKLFLDLTDIADFTNMETLNTNYISVTGSLSENLGNMIKLSLIAFGESSHTASEDLKYLFDALYTNGKTSGTLQVWAGSNKTLNGNAWVNGSTIAFSGSGWNLVTQ